MEFEYPLQQAILQRRYKRFLADVICPDGRQLTLHCPNTGSMKNCCDPGSRVWFWDSANPKRKYPCSWELVEVERQHLACVNTGRANALVREAVETGVLAELQGYEMVRPEVRYGVENSRIDLLLTGAQGRCFVEVKNVTLLRDSGLGAFPDAVSTRGAKHLRELAEVVRSGDRAVLCYCVAHSGIERVTVADDLDPGYGRELRAAMAAGVEVIAYGAAISESSIRLVKPLPVLID